MDIMQLRCFQAVAQTQKLTQVAERMHISQPAFSARLSKLEKELGVQLFDRVGRRIQLNKFGKAFIPYVDQALTCLDEGLSMLGTINLEEMQRLSLGAVSLQMIQSLLADFQLAFPEIVLRRYEIMPKDVQSELEINECDLVLCATCGESLDDPYCRTIRRDRLYLAVYEGHPFSDRKVVSLAELRDEPFISLPEGYSFRMITDKMCQYGAFECDVIHECFHCQMLDCVRDKIGISFATEEAILREQMHGNENDIVFLRLADPIAYRNVVLRWNPKRDLSESAKKFLNFASVYYADRDVLL